MTDSAARVIVENMPFNHSLKHIDFSFNFVGDCIAWRTQCACSAFHVLKSCCCVCAALQISGETLIEMGEALLQMPKVEVLLLGANAWNREEFREAVKERKELIDLTYGVQPRLRFKPFPK